MGRSLIRGGGGSGRATNPFVPILQLVVDICIVMVVMMFIDRLLMAILSFYYRFIAKPPHKRYRWVPVHEPPPPPLSPHHHDSAALLASTGHSYPKVLVQVPMYNEREVRDAIAIYVTYDLMVNCATSMLTLLPPLHARNLTYEFHGYITHEFHGYITREFHGYITHEFHGYMCMPSMCPGLPPLDRRRVWALVAVGSAHRASPRRFHGSNDEGMHEQDQDPFLPSFFSIASMGCCSLVGHI
jgi:hypothetical protein